MIANARMYAVSPDVGRLWRALFASIGATTGPSLAWVEHAAPAPLEQLWRRADMGAVFMCGLPYARAEPKPVLIAAPVPSPAAYRGEARYWSEFVVRHDSAFDSVADTFGRRIAFTVPDSQSGCAAALEYFQALEPDSRKTPLFAELIAPTVTPLGALEAVIRGAADIAPIDSYAFSLFCAHRPDLTAQVRIVGRTAPTPIPPLVASAAAIGTVDVEVLSTAFLPAHADPASKALLAPLELQRFVRPEPASYAILGERFLAAIDFWRARSFAAVTHSAFAW